jgi:hypothetical protein
MPERRIRRTTGRCFVCSEYVVTGAGAVHLGFGICIHHACGAIVDAEERLYDRSRRRHGRPGSAVVQQVRALRSRVPALPVP